ncbi:MAG: enhanced serine sensitivity protein SseB C-terminal domain-containing protein [Ruminiclostridium sp.]|nr:enhanced serine sensitivity protein SseB C-terminal domain-containing protein [Ruminiclostridium sp.]
MAENEIKMNKKNVNAATGEAGIPEGAFPDLENGPLIEAMNALKKEENKETQTALIEKVLTAKFFAPVDIIDGDGNPVQGTGKIQIPENSKFNFKLIQNSKGEQFFPVFTDIEEFQKWNKQPKINTIIVIFPQIAQLAMQKSEELSGFVINPMTQNIIFSQDAIKHLLDAMNTVVERHKAEPKPVQLMFGKPANVPEAVYGAFRKKLKKYPEVSEAYFCMLKRDEHEFYLFTLEIDAENERCKKIGDELCESAKMFLTKFPIMAAPVKSPFGEGAKKVGEPFYTKE